MKIKNIFLAAVLYFLNANTVFADQIRGNLHMVGWSVGTVNEAVISIDAEGPNFFDWDADENDPDVGFVANCLVPYVGWILQMPIGNDYGKQLMAALASANATGQTVVISYYVGVVPGSDPETEACYVDTATILGVAS